jgi:threonine/homoserine/homoserine lactone efflux protein
MTESAALFLSSVGISIAFSLAPGAVATEALRRGVDGGARSVMLVRLGALGGNLVWAAVALAGGGLLVQHPPVRLLFGIAGSLLLLRMARTSLASFRQGVTGREAAPASRRDLAAGAVLALASPMHVVFWLGVANTAPAGGMAACVAGFSVGYMLYTAVMAALLASVRRAVGDGLFRWAHLGYGAFAAYLGMRLLLNTARLL